MEIKYAAGHLLRGKTIHARQVQKRCVFQFLDEQILPYGMLHLCPQLGMRFLADSNSWNVNGTPNLRTVRQMLTVLGQTTSDNVFTQLSVLFQLSY